MALLLLMHKLMSQCSGSLHAVTVDHALRAGSADEAQVVAQLCADLGVPHDILRWGDWDGRGNLQDAARRARYGLMADWAVAGDIRVIALAHTRDDQAETVLMRLGRAAGVDGLSAMSARYDRYGVTWVRPLLAIDRNALRDFLNVEGARWVEDPSNTDARFDRVKARAALEHLAPLGITVDALAQTAQHMAQARAALEHATAQVLRRIARSAAGAIVLDRVALASEPEEIQRRAYLAALRWITNAEHAPRARALEAVLTRLIQDGSATLDGCHLRIDAEKVWIFREFQAVRSARGKVGELWDGRWCVAGPDTHVHVAALGPDGLAACPEWRDTGIPRAALLSTPAVWSGNELIAAPVVAALLGRPCSWRAKLQPRQNDPFDAGHPH